MKLNFFTTKKLALIAIIMVTGFFKSHGQILSYTNDVTGALSAVATNATGTALSRINGATTPGTPCGTGFSSASFTSATTYSSSLPGVETDATPNTGYQLNVTGFSAGLRRSSTGPADVRFAVSTDGGTTWAAQGINQAPSNSVCGTTITCTWDTAITVSAPGMLQFRVYGFDASGTSGTMQILDLTINGTVTALTSGCGITSGLTDTAITTTSATLNWATVAGAVSYNIQYRQLGTTTWSTTASATNSVNITGLTPGTTYEFQVQTVCAGSVTSAFTGSTDFTTLSPACSTPSGLSTTAVTTTSATLDWTAVSGAVSYNIQYRVVGTTTWSTTTSGTNSVNITGLTPGTNYEFQVQTVCAGSATSSFSASGDFTTLSLSCTAPSGLTTSAITTTSATLAWTAVSGAISYHIEYRPVGSSTWTTTSSGTNSIVLSGLTAGTNYQFQVLTVCSATDSSGYSSSTTFTTLPAGSTSASSGKIAIYFNNPVNTSVSTGVDAIYLDNAFADTIVAYINRARYSVDIAQYDYNQSSSFANIATAVNNAYLAGKKVRWIYDGSQPNTGIALLNPGIHTLASPVGGVYGIMHNKFVLIDANSTNPDDAIVCTGSEDWGVSQLNSDNNNLLFIQDSALAHAYTSEFNMMWGDTGVAPNTTLSKFGPYKTDLGRHTFYIGGNLVELYFSPSDSTDTHIQESINSANTDLYFGVYDFTMSDDATAIVARKTAGIYTAGIVDQYSNTGSAYPILTAGLGTSMKTFVSSTLIYHHKMVIVDPSNACSDPLVLTGSHNWTYSANTINDENTLILHNDTIANIYYQAFDAEYTALGGSLTAIAPCTATTCGNATGLSATMITTTSALLNWTTVAGATSYTIQYRAAGTTTWSTTTSPVNSVTVSGLSPATTYEFQVETICASGTSSFTLSTDFTTLALPCSIPTGLSAVVSATSATLNWTAVSGAVSYSIQYRQVGTTTWSTTTSPSNSVFISGLTAGTNYEFQVEVICSPGTSGYSGSTTFTTTTIACPIPTGLSATSITATSALLTWSAVTGAASYTIQYRPTGTSGWSYTTSPATSATISGLIPSTPYEFQVQTICSSGDSSGYTISTVFSTTSGVAVNSLAENSFYIYPNPTMQQAEISYKLSSAENVSLSIYDVVGQEVTVVVKNEAQTAGAHHYSAEISAPGVYFVKLVAGKTTFTRKVVKL